MLSTQHLFFQCNKVIFERDIFPPGPVLAHFLLTSTEHVNLTWSVELRSGFLNFLISPRPLILSRSAPFYLPRASENRYVYADLHVCFGFKLPFKNVSSCKPRGWPQSVSHELTTWYTLTRTNLSGCPVTHVKHVSGRQLALSTTSDLWLHLLSTLRASLSRLCNRTNECPITSLSGFTICTATGH